MDCSNFFEALKNQEVEFFSGVPDSLLKDICAYITDHVPASNHIIASNEGASVGLATGYHLGSGKVPLVYLQNSGLGNTVNPLLSLADPEVYSIPMLVMIGWRGEPGLKDEPQHVKQGRVMIAMLDCLEVPYFTLSKDIGSSISELKKAHDLAVEKKCPVALVVKKGVFDKYTLQNDSIPPQKMTRELAIQCILKNLDSSDLIVSNTGKISREVFEYRESTSQGHDKDFLTVGSMGHTSQIALGLAIQTKNRQVFCLDGDGSVLMHMGSLAINGQSGIKNFKHIVLNNGSHDSVGGQPTVAFQINIPAVAKACGYSSVKRLDDENSLAKAVTEIRKIDGPLLLEVLVKKGARNDLGRPTTTPVENKLALMENLV